MNMSVASQARNLAMAMEGDVLTLAEGAKYLKVCERTLWQLAKDGKVPHTRVGRQYRFLRAALRGHLAGGMVTQA